MKNNTNVLRRFTTILILCLWLTISILAAAGDLDLTFDMDGKVITTFGVSSHDTSFAVAVQADGKIVVGGSSRSGSSNSDFALARYNADGSLDMTFGTGGRVVTAIGASDDSIGDIAIRADGKIVAVGASVNGPTYDVAVARYNSDGSLDLTFDTDGKVTTAIGASDDFGNSVALSGVNIVVAGLTTVSAFNTDFAILRYKPDGSLDGGFGTGGIVTTPIGILPDAAEDVAIQTDGKIVAAGHTYNGLNNDIAIARYNPDGSLDPGFGTGGIAVTAIGTNDLAYSVAIQTDGLIVIAGTSASGGNDDFALVRYKHDGNLDPVFDGDGIVTTPIGGAGDFARSVAIQSNGKIIAAGSSGNGANRDFALVRYNSNGSLDTGFGTGGKVTTPFGADHDEALGMAIQADGKIVLAGSTFTGASGDFAVARYLAEPNGFLYVIRDATTGNQLYGFSVNETTGALTALAGFPIITGGSGSDLTPSEQIAIDRANSRLYVINDGSNTVNAYAINPTTGAWSELPFSPISLGIGAWDTIAVHPTGSPLVIGDSGGPSLVRSYTITATTATEAAGSPFATGAARPFSSVFSRNGNFFYTGGNFNTEFAGFSVSGPTGVLTPLAGSPFDSGNDFPAGYATDSQGRIFMANIFAGQLRAFTTTGGVPSAVTGNPFASSLSRAVDGVLHPNEQFYFAADRLGNQIGSYQIGGTGAATTLTAVPGSPFASGGAFTNSLVTNQAGTFLFAANANSRNLTTYAVNSTNGVLTNIGVQPANTLGTTGRLTGVGYYTSPSPGGSTSASVTVGGRVTTASGRGISRATVTLIGGNGETHSAITNQFGYYRFYEVEVNETYILQIRHKRYQFAPQVITVTEEIGNLDFVAL